MKPIILSWRTISRLGELPECRACGRVLVSGEKVYKTLMNGGRVRNYFCAECIEKKAVLVYPIFKRRQN